jgi:uncharacterized protein DUF4760
MSLPEVVYYAANIGQFTQAIAAIILLFIATNIRESIRLRYLEGMKYTRDLIGTPEAADNRRWVHEALSRIPRPFSGENANKARGICRDFDHIGLLCRKGLLPKKVIIQTYSRNILEMWGQLKPVIDQFRKETQDEDYFAEFDWLAGQAGKAKRKGSVWRRNYRSHAV